MANQMRGVIMVATAMTLVSVAYAVAGTATFYTTYVPSACYGYQGKGVMIAAANKTLYNNGAACGKRYRVTCTGPTNQGIPNPCRGNSVTVTIVDLCPLSGCSTMDLSKQAFAAIANPDAGRIKINYYPV